eukprot:scaffold538141_cov17-Prasinocladus_malaysianus.AAC.1
MLGLAFQEGGVRGGVYHQAHRVGHNGRGGHVGGAEVGHEEGAAAPVEQLGGPELWREDQSGPEASRSASTD